MNQEKFGKFIKELRQKHGLTQKEFADKYYVTYQAVSKWENGKNMPDSALIKKISEDFNVSLEELYNGELKPKKNKKHLPIIIIAIIIFIIIIGIIILKHLTNNDFQFKTLSANCPNFTISGSLAYNNQKSAIYISNIEYCGGDDTEKYQNIECILYEKNKTKENVISTYKYQKNEKTTIENFLKEVSFTIDNYEKTCKVYKDNTIFLKVIASLNNKKTTYEIPLKLDKSCQK